MQSCKDLRIIIPTSCILVHIVLSADAPGTSRCSVPLAASFSVDISWCGKTCTKVFRNVCTADSKDNADCIFYLLGMQVCSYYMRRKRCYRSTAPIQPANRVAYQEAGLPHNVRDTCSSPTKLRASQEHDRRTVQCVARMLVAMKFVGSENRPRMGTDARTRSRSRYRPGDPACWNGIFANSVGQ